MTGISTDCRTRSYVSKKQTRFGSISSTDSSHSSATPARIFEHFRGGPDADVGAALDRKSFGWSPASFKEIETWLDSQVDEALRAAATGATRADDNNARSAIKIIFLNEKRCDKAWKDEVCDVKAKLHPKLKIEDFTTAHYMTTYCRFPVPLSVDGDGEEAGAAPGHSWEYRYSVSHPFDWDMVWAYFPSTRTTIAIVRTWFEDYNADFQEMEDIIDTFAGPTLAHPMVLGMFGLQLLTDDTLASVREKGNRIYEAQRLTGFHAYTHLRTTDSLDDDNDAASSDLRRETADLAVVTREVLGSTANLTGWLNAADQLIDFANFVAAESQRFAGSPHSPPVDTPARRPFARLCAYMEHNAEKQVSDLKGARCDARAWLATAGFLMQGVLNVISQRDASMNIQLARNSNKIALEAKRDSTSMMAIAVVTMFFLPGTFTSSFFALPFISDADSDSTPHLRVYWAVTVPLTAAVISVWFAWIWFMRPRVRASMSEKEKT